MKKIEKIIIEEDNIAYRISGDYDNIKMNRSNSSIWNESCKGEEIISLKDNGNNVKIKFNGKKLKLEYDELCYLSNILKIKIKEDPGFISENAIYEVL